MTLDDFRSQFPALKELTWLNAAASSPLATPVAEAIRQHVNVCERQGDLAYPRWIAQKEAVRTRLARFINAEPGEVAFTPSTSFGFHLVAAALQSRGIQEVLVLDHEFPSTTVPFLKAGLIVRGVRRRPDGTFPVDDIEGALRPTTGAIAVSMVQYNSGFRVDLPQVAALARSRNIPLCINAAQALGHLPLDFKHLGAAFLASTSHKWLGAGYGLGMLVVEPSWWEALSVAGWLSVPPELLWQPFPGSEREDDAQGFLARTARVRHDASVVEGGGGVWLNFLALDAALNLHEQVGPSAIFEQIQRLAASLRHGLEARGFTPNAPSAPRVASGICVVPVEGAPEDAVKALAHQAKVVTTARGGGIRVSTHAYNTERDVTQLFQALEQLKIRPKAT
jgi:selenocysteine lyase/cysteine desulfurase